MTYLATLYIRWRYAVLLGTLLLVLVVHPLSFGFSTTPQMFDIFLILVTVALLLSFCPQKNKRLAAIAFGIPTGLLLLVGHLIATESHNTAVLIGHCIVVLFYFWAAALIVASLFAARHCRWIASLDRFVVICFWAWPGACCTRCSTPFGPGHLRLSADWRSRCMRTILAFTCSLITASLR